MRVVESTSMMPPLTLIALAAGGRQNEIICEEAWCWERSDYRTSRACHRSPSSLFSPIPWTRKASPISKFFLLALYSISSSKFILPRYPRTWHQSTSIAWSPYFCSADTTPSSCGKPQTLPCPAGCCYQWNCFSKLHHCNQDSKRIFTSWSEDFIHIFIRWSWQLQSRLKRWSFESFICSLEHSSPNHSNVHVAKLILFGSFYFPRKVSMPCRTNKLAWLIFGLIM